MSRFDAARGEVSARLVKGVRVRGNAVNTESLTLADAVRYHMGTALNPMEIGIVLFLSDRMGRRELERFVSERLLAHARFRQTVAKAPFPLRPFWQAEAGFSLADHIAELPGPALGDEELAQRLAEGLSQRLPPDRSPWRLELFPLADGRSALHLRVHHCLGDGLSLVRLLCELADEPRPALPRGAAHPHRARPSQPTPQRARRLAGELGRTLVDTLASRADPARELHALSGNKRVAWSRPLDLTALTQLAEAHGRHVTELLLGAAAEALADALAASGCAVPKRVRALVPTGASLGERELGNHYASTFVELVLDEPEPWRRIERMSKTTGKLRDAAQARLARTMIGCAGWLSPPVMRRAMGFMSRRASLVVSNVPGPAEPVRLLGHEVRSVVVFAPPAASIGVSFTLFGYAGALRLGVQTDAAVPLPPSELVHGFERALQAFALEH
jgi:diacylglycerol O-acyltransferase